MDMEREKQATARRAEEDRISDLPDCIVHHILSFLPSTKQAIRTSILSKRWFNQWTHVPVLIFDYCYYTDISPENFVNFVDYTLSRHDCSKIKKFHLQYPYRCAKADPQFDAKILSATRKHVEELYLNSNSEELLPEFLFNNASSLVKLTACISILMPDRKVNWGCLTSLKLYSCELTDQGLQHILSGSPLLELFELINCSKFDKLVIASKSLKKLVLRQDYLAIEISCPNLVELFLVGVKVVGDANLFNQVIENVLSTSPLLESFELDDQNCPLPHNQLVIASQSLKRLFLRLSYNIFNLHVSCPQLELLVLSGWFNLRTTKLLDLPSLLCATFDLEERYNDNNSICKTLVRDILQQLHHVKQLTIGRLFIKILSTLGVGDPFPSVLNVKSLTLNYPNLNKDYSGIARLLHHAPELEKLVINAKIYDQTWSNNFCLLAKLELDDFWENFCNPDAAVFNCLVSHLKTIKIISFPNSHYELKFMMSFVQFLLKNARVLEKMTVITKDKTNVPFTISHKLLHLPRCSKQAIVELL